MSSSVAGLDLPPLVEALAEAVEADGGRAYLVGGGVRDHLLGLPLKDVDVEVFGLAAHTLESLLHRLGRVNEVGRSFGVYKLRPFGRHDDELLDIDVSIPRRDSNVGPGHKGIKVEGDPTMSLAEAVRRRDLTINALMVEIRGRTLIDQVDGVADLRQQRLRAVDQHTFLDDPLRALRVVQFAARTGFQPTEELLDLCRRAPLAELPAERIQGEWFKLLLRGTHLELGLQIARSAAMSSRVFPERVDDPALDACLQSACRRRDELPDDGRRWALMLTLWLAHSPVEAAEATLDRLCLFTVGGFPARKVVLTLLAHLHLPLDTDTELRRASVVVELQLLLAVREALDPKKLPPHARARASALGITQKAPRPLLAGRDLAAFGVRGGVRMGQILKDAYEQQLEGVLSDKAQALAWAQSKV